MKVRVLFVGVLVALNTLGVPSHLVAPASAAEPIETAEGIAAIVRPGTHLTRSVTLPWRANLVGVSFVGSDGDAPGIAVEMRALGPDGWSPWIPQPIDDHDGADGEERRNASSRVFTAPQWVGLADRLEVRVVSDAGAATIGDVRLVAINSVGNAKPVPAPVRALRTLRRVLGSTPAPPAEASPGKPRIITRAGWGANESWRSSGPGSARSLRMAFVHHTVNSNSYSKSESAALVRGIYRYHTQTRDYSDIAYNFLIDRYGQIFEGRWGGVTKPVIGAHALGFNTGSTGIALVGTFTSSSPPSGMLSSLRKLLAWKLDVHHIPPKGKVAMISGGNDKYDKGSTAWLNRISGHRDGNSTACPGYETYRRLGSIRDGVDGIGHPKIYLPAVSTTTVRPDGDGVNEAVKLTASFSRTVSWSVSFVDSAGVLRRKLIGKGSSLSATWNGKLSSGSLAPTGKYKWLLAAKNSAGHYATPVRGTLYVVNKHPTGSYLRDANGHYVLGNGKVRMLDSLTALAEFHHRAPARTGAGERAWYVHAGAWPLRRGVLLKGPDDHRYIWTGTQLRRFATDAEAQPPLDAYQALGYADARVFAVGQAYIDSLPAGPPVDDTTVHPAESVIKDMATGRMYVTSGEELRPLTTLVRKSRYHATEVVAATAADMLLPVGAAYPVRQGALIRANDGGTPYVALGTVKRRFIDWSLFSRMGYTTAMLFTASDADLAVLPNGRVFG